MPRGAIAPATVDVAAQRLRAAEGRQREERQVAHGDIRERAERERVGRRVRLARVAAVVEEARQGEELRPEEAEHGADVTAVLDERCVGPRADVEAAIRIDDYPAASTRDVSDPDEDEQVNMAVIERLRSLGYIK